ncbi:MAG: M50 family metallopeptidase [Patescibacteria group bacterium]|nr:M50 family metallopeptidase [bacterium]MDZ4221836.1 M50 family metallopeptidase [Patescibacteria group bacterium]
MIITIIGFIAILAFLVLVHEAGHFFAARRFGIGVEEFGLGFPPKLWSFRRGKTVYSINAIPLGGFVKIKGEDAESVDDPDSFGAKPVWQRAIVICAGVTMNIVAGWALLTVLFMAGAPVERDGSIEQRYFHNPSLAVTEVIAGSPAESAGILPGDTILSADGVLFTDIAPFQKYVDEKAGTAISIQYRRGKEEMETSVAGAVMTEVDGERSIIGVGLAEVGVVRMPPHKAALAGTIATGNYLDRIVRAFGGIIAGLFRGDGAGDSLGGPVAIAIATGDALDLGWAETIIFTAILSFNLAIINILPFPALDGGRLIFLGLEAVRRKPSRAEVEAWFHRAGFALLMLLAVVITYHDLARFGGRIWRAVLG